MGRIMVNGENYSGSEVVANPTLEGGEPTLNSLEIDGDKFALGGGGGSSGSIVKIYDSGSDTQGAPLNQTITYINNVDISNYDLIYAVYSSDRGGTYPQSLQLSGIIDEIINDNVNGWAIVGYGDRWTILRVNATDFSVINGNGTYQIFKLYAVKL